MYRINVACMRRNTLFDVFKKLYYTELKTPPHTQCWLSCLKNLNILRWIQKNRSRLTTAAFFSPSPVLLAANYTTVDIEQVFEPDDPRLRTPECLKNASGLSVDSSSAVLSQTVYAIQRIEKEYQELTLALARQTEIQMELLGDKDAEEKIADIILETRQRLDAVKQRKQDLQLLFSSAEKLCDAAAEVAFAAGMTFASTCMGERLYSAQLQVQRFLAKSEEAEKRLQHFQVKVIEKMGRLADEELKRIDEEEELKRIEEEEELKRKEEDLGDNSDDIDNEINDSSPTELEGDENNPS